MMFESANPPGSVRLQQKPVLGLEVSQLLAAAAFKEAKSNGWNVTIAIVDDGGHTIYLAKMDGCQIGSVNIAQHKAVGAVNFKRPTKAMQDFVKDGNTHMLGLPGLVPVEGGLPIVLLGHIVGAIGISGVTSAQDGLVAAAALAELARMDIAAA
jgi:glc operon protein GlcG